MKVSAILAASVASLAIAAPLTEGNLGLENVGIDSAEKVQLTDLQAQLFTCISNPECIKKLQQGALSSPTAPLGKTKRQEVDDFQKFQDKLLTCSNNPACAKKLDKLKIPGQVLEPESTKEILDNIGNVQTCLATAKCRKDLFEQIDKLIDGAEKSKRQNIPLDLASVTSCLAKPECATKLIGRQGAQAAAAAGEMTKRQVDPIGLEAVMACLQDPVCTDDLMSRIDLPRIEGPN